MEDKNINIILTTGDKVLLLIDSFSGLARSSVLRVPFSSALLTTPLLCDCFLQKKIILSNFLEIIQN